jgi:hypothetical protein
MRTETASQAILDHLGLAPDEFGPVAARAPPDFDIGWAS